MYKSGALSTFTMSYNHRHQTSSRTLKIVPNRNPAPIKYSQFPSPSPGQPPVCPPFYRFAYSRYFMPMESHIKMCCRLCLASFTQCNVFKVHLYCVTF